MKTIIYNNQINTIQANNIKKLMAFSSGDKKEGIFMSLITSFIFKNDEVKEKNKNRKKSNQNEDYGYNLYKSLEFTNDREKTNSHNNTFELLSNKLY